MISRAGSCDIRTARATALLILIGMGLAACQRETATPWPEGVVPSEILEPHVRETLDRLQSPAAGDPNRVADLFLYDEIRQGLYDRGTRKQASSQLQQAWSSNPSNPLWPEFAMHEWRMLDDYRPVFEIFKTPVCADTLTAVGLYAATWRKMDHGSMVADFDRALEWSKDADPFLRFWIALSSAFASRIVGEYDECVEKNLRLLPEARALGGPRLESIVWHRIAPASMDRGDLDDALIAAILADTLATLAGGPMVGVLDARLSRADVLATRGESQEALAQYEANFRTAEEYRLATSAGENLNRAGTLADAMGNLKLALDYDLQGLRLALADEDSFNVPAHLANISNGYRLMGELDSCRAYLMRAERWVDADPQPYNIARLALVQRNYFTQIGAYDVVDSLLDAAQARSEQFNSTEERAELYIELIRGWMQSGRPDLVYRLIETASEFRSGVADTHADRNVTADLNLLIGEFYTRRAQYALADDALDLAATALEVRPDPEKSWILARNRGLLDRARGNLRGAEAWFRECVRIAEGLAFPTHVAAGRLLVGSVLLESGDFAGARQALPRDAPDASLDTRILSMLFTGVSHLREGQPGLALGLLEPAHTLCRSWTPLDLVGRVELEIGRAHALMGNSSRAQREYDRAASRIRDVDFQIGSTEELAYFTGDLRRDLVEAHLALGPENPRASLAFAEDLLPRWTTTNGILRAPQLIFFVGEELSGRWLVSESSVSWSRLPGSGEITARIAPVLADLSVPGTAIRRADIAALSEVLLTGLESAWSANETLHIVPDLELFGVPWSALDLPGTEMSVIEHGPVIVLDRPTSGDPRPRSAGNRLLLIAANRGGASGMERLRNAEREATEIGAVWPAEKSDLRIGAAAVGSLKSGAGLSSYRAIHVASHALVYSGRADQTTLQLEENAPSASTIRDLEIAADLVFLSACEAGDGGASRSVHAGLARSFQDAGARQVIAPISVIDDDAARELAVAFYRHWTPETSVANALRAAQLAQRGGKRSHPFYWAFYQVFGEDSNGLERNQPPDRGRR